MRPGEPGLLSPDLGAAFPANGVDEEQSRFEARLPGRQTKRHLEKGGKLNTSQAGSVAASRAAVGQFLSISREAFILKTQ